MPRVSPAKVLELVHETSLDVDVIDTNMLATANRYVTTNLGAKGLSDGTLADIELYLAAHFVTLVEERGGMTWSELGDARERYSDIYVAGLQSTRFGQQAIIMDTTGTLAELSRPQQRAQFRVV